jgi:peroxiredoxin
MRIASLASAACLAGATLLAATLVAAGPVTQDDAKKSDTTHTDKPQKDDKTMKAEKAEIGHPAPAFSLKGVDGKTYTLADMKGKTVVIEWFSPYCPYSGQTSPDSYWSTGRAMKVIDGMKAADPDAVYLCINSTHPGYNGKSEAENGADSAAVCKEIPMLMDPEGTCGKAYGAKTTPHMFVIDRAGNLAYIGAPTCDDGKDMYVVDAVTAIKDGKAPSPSVTKNKGCGVKYAKK